MNSRRQNQFFFYMDIVLVGVGAVALVALVHDAFSAGYASETDLVAYSDYMTRIALEAALLTIAMVYLLARFYKARVRELANPWA